MTPSTKFLKQILESATAPLLVALLIFIYTSRGGDQREASMVFFMASIFLSMYSFILLGFIFGILGRKYFLVGLIPFILWSFSQSFGLIDPVILSHSSGTKYFGFIGFLMTASLFGWVVGWTVRKGWELSVRYRGKAKREKKALSSSITM